MSRRAGRPSLSPAGVPEAEAFALCLKDVAAVRKAIECRSGESFAAEHLGPLLEGQIRGQDQALPLVGRAAHVKEELGPYRPGRNVAPIRQER